MALNEAVSGRNPFKGIRLFQVRRSKRPRTYILPTGFGLAFGAMSLVLFFMAVGYANNLIYIFFFFLVSVAVTGMVITNRNVNHVRFERIKGGEIFAGETGLLKLIFVNISKSESWDLEAYFGKQELHDTSFSLKAAEEKEIGLHFHGKQRGLQSLPRLYLQSRFPFSLLRAWKNFDLEDRVLVFPLRKGRSLFPEGSLNGDHIQNLGLFRDHRIYQPGDSIRRIDWKASARRQETLIKNFEEPEVPALDFHWDQTEGLDFEDRISQLALWVDEAEKKSFRYSMTVGKYQQPTGQGKAHWLRCLEILALFQPKELT